MTLPLFDYAEAVRTGEQLKEHGMQLAASNNQELLDKVRVGVEQIALSRDDRTATADDAANWLVANHYSPHALKNAAGSLFKEKKWEFTGRWIKSQRPWAHCNDIRIWRLK